MFLYLDFVPGESTAEDFESWIDVSSFSLGCTMEVDQEAVTGNSRGTSGSGDPEDLSIDKKMDAATTTLLFCCATGVVIPRGKLMQFNDAGDRVLVSEYAFGDSVITSVNLSASGGGIPEESLSINYGSVIWQYHCYDHFRPTNLVATFTRAWSLISSNPGQADPSTVSAHGIAKGSTGGLNSVASNNSYWTIGRGKPPLGFSEVKPFRMPRPTVESYQQ